MARGWTFGRKVGAGFAVTIVLAVAISIVGMFALKFAVSGKDKVISGGATMLTGAERLRAETARKASAFRGYLIVGTPHYLDDMRSARAAFLAEVEGLRATAPAENERRLIDAVASAEENHQRLIDEIIALRSPATSVEPVRNAFDTRIEPAREILEQRISAFITVVKDTLAADSAAATRTATASSWIILILAVFSVVFAILVAYLVTRTLGRQIATAVGEVESSSAELQTAASQQASGAKEEATAMAEITTTMNELLATSRQIAESAQRVAKIAEQTASSATTGRGTVEAAQEVVTGIRRQVDLIVEHMLELGDKSQQIGAVLDIVAELAEQTNILAINATIEAAGAGDHGSRFAVVADEIRNLADRVSGSAKEIRDLIEEIRGAVNTTVMATETGSKTVDDGTRQFGVVADSLRDITDLVATTAEAAREIELSTKQQTTAVEQVNVAIVSVAQATRETEASSNETRQTATQLAGLSKKLLRLVHPQVSG